MFIKTGGAFLLQILHPSLSAVIESQWDPFLSFFFLFTRKIIKSSIVEINSSVRARITADTILSTNVTALRTSTASTSAVTWAMKPIKVAKKC